MSFCLSIWMLPHMTSHLYLLILSSLAVSYQLGMENVFFSPQDQTVREGGGVFFQCVSGESSPPASISWLKDGEVVTRGRQIQGEFGGGNQKKTSGTLHLFNVTLEDDGIYICVTHNPSLNISNKSKPAKLTVQGIPRRLQIIQGPDNITVAMGTEVSMHCTAHGFPVPMVHWFKNGCHLTNCSKLFSLQNNGQLLTFRNVAKEDEGLYHCEASNQNETIKSQPAFLLVAEMDWSFVQQPMNLTVKRGENIRLTCRPPHSRPAAQVTWFKNNQPLAPSAHVTLLPSGDLYFLSIQEFDSGSYFCRASNIHLNRFLTSRRATLTVLATPSVKVWPQLLTVPVGARVLLECQVSGHPLPSINWIKRGHSRQTGGKVALGLRNATLHIQSARSYDEGVYMCVASNPLGQSHDKATLRVTVSPIIVTFTEQVSSRIGTSVVLPCRAVGILPITYTWTRGNTETQSPVSAKSHTDENGALHILNIQRSDGGEYYCTAENRAGRLQRRAILTVTAENHPADRGKQMRPVLSAGTNTDRAIPVTSDSFAKQHLKTTGHPHVQSQLKEAACTSFTCDATTLGATTVPTFSRGAVTEIKMSPESAGHFSHHQPIHLTTSPNQLLLTQIAHPILPPKLLPNIQSVDPHNTQLLRIGAPHFISVHEPPPTIDPVTEVHHLITKGQFYQSYHEPTSTSISQTMIENPHNPQPSPTQTKKLQPHSQESFIFRFLPKFHLEQSTTQPVLISQLPPSVTTFQLSHVDSQPLTTKPTSIISALPQSQPQPSSAQQPQPSISTIDTHSDTSRLITLDPEFYVVPQLNQSDRAQLNDTQQSESAQSAKSTNDTELSEWLKRNTSQSPMTSNDPRVTQPSWLPMVEKHDIPIVVGVGVSLAFIFITVTFYSVVQKNQPVPTNRAAQRNVGVPIRHTDRRAAGRTYENRAFEDDDCVAVIEQSPYTSDTRARPPGPSLVTVQMEPTVVDLQDTQLAVDSHSVIVETYHEPILDTKIDPSLEEEKGCSISQPNIQLQCAQDWISNRGDNQSQCQDPLPPPSSLPSCSPSPSPPSRRKEGLHTSLTLQSPEQCAAPLHHSLSISHGNPPLLLSHHLSLGLTTVAVDVHFYPPATASLASGTNTHVSSVSHST